MIFENQSVEEREQLNFEDICSGTVVEYIDKNFAMDKYYGIVVKDIDNCMVGIFDFEDEVIFLDYENYTVLRTFPNATITI